GRGRRGRRPGARHRRGAALRDQPDRPDEGGLRRRPFAGEAGGEAGRFRPGRPGLLRHPQGGQWRLGPDGRGLRRRRTPRPLGGGRLPPAAQFRRRGRCGGGDRVSLPSAFLGAPIAHRGLWRSGGAPENSLAAFEAACRAGYGIELDVRLSADGEAMVFHDETLERLTASAGLVEEQTADELQALRLFGSCEVIPTLDEVLVLIDGRTPLLVELKTPVR